ncbi:hypothetical protein VTL71DRAFT_2790 [Oculimacula yallundae]|uniref:Uncharacterized protein n=1 Tax=Oculimacula yallundae TaxID=86028 RepID=A0ABR4C9V3_9HELO
MENENVTKSVEEGAPASLQVTRPASAAEDLSPYPTPESKSPASTDFTSNGEDSVAAGKVAEAQESTPFSATGGNLETMAPSNVTNNNEDIPAAGHGSETSNQRQVQTPASNVANDGGDIEVPGTASDGDQVRTTASNVANESGNIDAAVPVTGPASSNTTGNSAPGNVAESLNQDKYRTKVDGIADRASVSAEKGVQIPPENVPTESQDTMVPGNASQIFDDDRAQISAPDVTKPVGDIEAANPLSQEDKDHAQNSKLNTTRSDSEIEATEALLNLYGSSNVTTGSGNSKAAASAGTARLAPYGTLNNPDSPHSHFNDELMALRTHRVDCMQQAEHLLAHMSPADQRAERCFTHPPLEGRYIFVIDKHVRDSCTERQSNGNAYQNPLFEDNYMGELYWAIRAEMVLNKRTKKVSLPPLPEDIDTETEDDGHAGAGPGTSKGRNAPSSSSSSSSRPGMNAPSSYSLVRRNTPSYYFPSPPRTNVFEVSPRAGGDAPSSSSHAHAGAASMTTTAATTSKRKNTGGTTSTPRKKPANRTTMANQPPAPDVPQAPTVTAHGRTTKRPSRYGD